MRLDLRPRPSVRVDCVFDDGVTIGAPAIPLELDPVRLAEVTVGGRKLKGHGMKATVFDDDDGTKLAMKWSPDEPVAGQGDDGTQMRRVRFSLNIRTRHTTVHAGLEGEDRPRRDRQASVIPEANPLASPPTVLVVDGSRTGPPAAN